MTSRKSPFPGVFTTLVTLLCGLTLTLAGIVHHEPGEIQESFNLFNLLNNYVGPAPPRSANVSIPTIVTECPPNVIFVIDGSGSISYSGFETAKTAVIREIRALYSTFAQVDVGVVLFSEENSVIPIESRTQPQVDQLIQRVQQLDHPRLGTELNEAIRVARRALADHSRNSARALNGDKSGNILVLFTDGQVESDVELASAREVQEAQARGILVLIDTVEEPSRTVQNIAPTVLESRTPISWVDYVACPPTTIDPIPSGSECRDFYLVVDGSDTVLRFEDTIRQYLAYTALRYRAVNNAIGVNIYGTDATVQARNTRIRLTEDKHELADDIRQELVFPRSRGAGTDRAILQSIGFLNDDIRDRPAAMVLIMNGPPLNIQATAQAIRQARQQGYPVAVIRIGEAERSETEQLSGGDMRGFYFIDYVTDLFGVNFDTFLCGGQTGCQVDPRSCVRPRIFQRSSCSCVCGNSCPPGLTHDSDCQCVCLGQCPAGQVHDSNCLCRCPSTCPEGTRQFSDCTCSPCPNRCERGQFQDPNCACHCPTRRCPALQHQNAQCECVCDFDNRAPGPDGICIDDRQCQLTQQECGNLQLDYNSCRCVLNCPNGAIPVGATSCQCTDPSRQYNPNINRCVCQRSCPQSAIQNPNTCQCTCRNSCPQGQYSNLNRNCQCLCEGTDQPPQGGTCFACPANSRPVGTSSCQCLDPNSVYNPNTNLCVLNCPPDADPVDNTCRCRVRSRTYDATRNLCVCPNSCPAGSLQDSVTCNCDCSRQCPNGQYNNPNTNCRCLCLNTDQPPGLNGQCFTCPANSRPVGTSSCQCLDPNFVYNPNTNLCVLNCPPDADPVDNTCRCRVRSRTYDATRNLCVCDSSCPSGSIQDSVTCSCRCSRQCPSGQYNNPDTNCRCLCLGTNQPPGINGQCLSCPPNSEPVNDGCRCTQRFYVYNARDNVCVRDCPRGSILRDNTCQCTSPNTRYDPTSNQCVPNCPRDADVFGNTCRCRGSKRYDSTSNECVCTVPCPPGSRQDSVSCGCDCASRCPEGQYNNLDTNCRCLCLRTDQPPGPNGQCFSCPPNSEPVTDGCRCTQRFYVYNARDNVCVRDCPRGSIRRDNTCQCTNTNTRYDPTSNQCVTNCPRDAEVFGNTCRCRNRNRRYDSTSNTCVCTTQCPPGSRQDSVSCGCDCARRCPEGQYNTPNTNCRCLCLRTDQPPGPTGQCFSCPPNSEPVNDGCRCTQRFYIYNARDNVCVRDCPRGSILRDNTCQCTSPNTRYDSTSNQCVRDCPQGAIPRDNTCQCTNRNTRYDPTSNQCVRVCPQGAVLRDNTCQCTNQNTRYDPTSNQCVRVCPQGAILRDNTCQCTNPNTRYDPTSNQCVRVCPQGAILRDNTCQCTNTNTRYDPNLNQCVRVCPQGAILRDNTCQCTNPNTRYDPTSNQCVRVCPQGAILRDNTCQCTNTNTRYDPNLNQCVRVCPQGAILRDNTCQCTNTNTRYDPNLNQCVRVCPQGAILRDNTCQCTNTNTRYDPNLNQCMRVCPQGAILRDNTCQCTSPNTRYDPTSNQCVLNCPRDAEVFGNTCRCRNRNRRYDSTSNTCVCSTQCPPGSRQDSVSCGCDCARRCPEGQYNTPDSNCRCLCQGTNQPPGPNGQCLSCPPNSEPLNDGCRCTQRFYVYNARDNVCVRDCPRGSTRRDNTCQCTNQNTRYDPTSNQCVLNCPRDADLVDNTCRCRDRNRRYDSTSNACVCSTQCPPGSRQDSVSCGCDCARRCPEGQYNNPDTNCRCLCLRTDQPPGPTGQCFSCPPNSEPVTDGCRCTQRFYVYNARDNVCVLNCPRDAEVFGNTCRCRDRTRRYDSTSNTCVINCPRDGEVFGNTCRCRDRTRRYDSTSNTCVLNCPRDAEVFGNTCRCRDRTRRYDSTSNTCVLNCPRDAEVFGNTCRCRDRTRRYDSTSNTCVLNCPRDAEVFGNTCRCRDRNRRYDSTSNTCVPNCPRDAEVFGNTCRCRDRTRRYDGTSNTCACQTPCTVAGTVQDPNTCTCSCRNSCPNGQYNSLATNCRCLCQLDNTEPVNGICSDRQQECNLQQSDCPVPQLANTDPRFCRCELPVQRDRCSVAEWPCANGRPAFRNCHGACVCECSSEFAGPRCEIPVNASLCNDCHYIQGIYRAALPGFCDLYVWCHPVESAGTDERGRPNAFRAQVMSCPASTYYITRPNGYEVCDWPRSGTCTGDPCASLEPSARFADGSDCRCYRQCSAQRRLESRQCCPGGQGFDPNSQQCVPNPRCPDSSVPCDDGEAPSCPLVPVPGNPNQYYHASAPTARLSCQPSHIFDPTVCTCLPGSSGDTDPGLCVPTYQSDFEGVAHYEDKVSRVTYQGQRVGQFGGDDDLIIKAFAQSGFSTNHFQVDLRVNLAAREQLSRGRRMAVVTNADCDTIESVSITVDETNFYFRIYQEGSSTPAEIAIPYARLQDENGWYPLRLVYTGSRGSFQFTASVGSQTVTYQGPVNLTSYIDHRQCALHLGYGYNYIGFQGYMDDVRVWRCRP